MLGSYFNHQSRIPFIMLSVPNGENVLGENARRTFNAAKYDSAKRLYKFVAHGHVIIPRVVPLGRGCCIISQPCVIEDYGCGSVADKIADNLIEWTTKL